MIDLVIMAGPGISNLFPGGSVPTADDGVTIITCREEIGAIMSPGKC